MPERDVIVVGGGLAGLASAVALTEAGFHVTLLESRPRLGGRASSIVDAATGTVIDNCQHVSMGCCVNFQKLCRLTGTSDLFAVEPELHFIARDGKRNRLRNLGLPAPAHLAISFAAISYLSWRDKLSLARGVRALVLGKAPESGRFSDWLADQRQSRELIERFWTVVLVSALGESLDRIDFQYARQVFVQGFLRHRDAWQVHLLTIPLGEFYDRHLARWLKGRGAVVECKAGVAELELSADEQRVAAVHLRDGRRLAAEEFVLATAQDRADALLPMVVKQSHPFAGLSGLETAPITSVHLWLDRELTPLRHAVLVDRVGQWVFNRTAILRDASSPGEFAYQVVISNSRAVRDAFQTPQANGSQQQLIDTIWRELREIWPEAASARVLHARAITEHRAVFSVLPGIEHLRPPQQTPLINLQLAGDYTQTGWPATMEGAVRSGFLAAGNILQHQAEQHPDSPPTALLAPEMPAGWLARLLFGSRC